VRASSSCQRVRIADGRSRQQFLLAALPSISHLLPGLLLPSDLANLIRHDVDVALGVLRALFSGPHDPPEGIDLGAYVSALADMDIGLPGLDMLARLLKGADYDQPELLRLLLKQEVLGVYVARWVADVERSATAPEQDQELARRVRIVRARSAFSVDCRLIVPFPGPQLSLFAISLLDDGVLQAGEDVSMELAGFALRHSRFSDAQRLYSRLTSLRD
jgi:hypothetical protein